MAGNKYVLGWEWVKTERAYAPQVQRMLDREKERDSMVMTSSGKRSKEGLKAVALAAGLTLGLVGFVWWQKQQSQPVRRHHEPQTVVMSEPAFEEPEPVRQLVLSIPPSRLAIEKVLESARFWTDAAPHHDDSLLASMIWRDMWPSVGYPGKPREGDHASVREAHRLIDFGLGVGRSEYEAKKAAGLAELTDEQRAQRAMAIFIRLGLVRKDDPADDAPAVVVADAAPQSSEAASRSSELVIADAAPQSSEPMLAEDKRRASAPLEIAEPVRAIVEVEALPVVSAEVEALITDQPTPGRFYKVDAEVAEAGIEQLAVQTVLCAALGAMQRKGWPKDKAIAHVGKLAENTELLSNYVDLLGSSRWNAKRITPFEVGTLVWLPPIRVAALLDRRREPKISLDSRAWPDGSSRLEPPPVAWAA